LNISSINRMQSPTISVITPCLNSVKYIGQAIESVKGQSYKNVEHVIVDGGSTDGTTDLLKQHHGIRWISEPDNGQAHAMNKGFQMSSGEIIVYLNADDYFYVGAFMAVLKLFNEGAEFVIGKVRVVKDDGSFYINDPNIRFKQMLKWWETNAFCHNPLGYFYRRKVQEDIGGFNTSNTFAMDLEFLLEASQRVNLSKVDYLLGVFRLHEGTKTNRSSRDIESQEIYSFCDRFLVNVEVNEREQYLKDRRRYFRYESWRRALASLLRPHTCSREARSPNGL
jgi:glycosyltransferase involved in cell wall biosynthesis